MSSKFAEIKAAERSTGVAQPKWAGKFGSIESGTNAPIGKALEVFGDNISPQLTARTSIVFEPGVNCFVEASGAISGLTPAADGDVVGTWADTTGTHVLRANSGNGFTLTTNAAGRKVLSKTAANQYYASEAAASAWNFLHNGTLYSFAAAFNSAAATDDESLPIFGTYTGSSSGRGAYLMLDDRYSAASYLNHSVRFEIGNGNLTLNPVVVLSHPGISPGNWHVIAGRVDPSNGTAANRAEIYSFNRLSLENVKSNTPSASDATHTFKVGQLDGVTEADTALGDFGPIVFYQGTWIDDELENVQNWLSDGQRLQQLSTAQNVSGAVYAYEAFPLLLDTGTELLCFFRAGTSHAADRGRIDMMRSGDGGATWGGRQTIYQDDTYDVRDPAGIILANGDILVVTTLYDHTVVQDWPGPARCLVSQDGGQTFTLRSTINPPDGFDFIYPWGHFRQLSDRIIATAYTRETVSGDYYGEIWETTNGTIWRKRAQIAADLSECSIYPLGDTNWLCVARQATAGVEGSIFWATSDDDCLTWSAMTDTGQNGVSPCLIAVGDTIVCLIGDRTTPRRGIRAMVWADGRLHANNNEWMVTTLAGSGADFGYPSAVAFADGTVDMVWFDVSTPESGTNGVQFRSFVYPKLNG